ncbi:MAG: phosphoribosylformylglycinamidine cyclo-ligase [Propionibacteriaceae bacterium]|nr:phosphoribosylformylglycinamidine cyclo-ligase [Propionibacteriaceae bacterium]
MAPTGPETGYGYIQRGGEIAPGVARVLRFVEKPDLATAAGYLAEGNYSWNGGIFLFTASAYISALEEHAPDMATAAKVAIAQALRSYDSIGYDLVGMLIDDLVVVGAEPLFLTDYIACGKVFPERIAAIVSGIAAACAENNVALIGGESAEHPGLLEPDEFDVAGATTGVVEADELLGPARVRNGDLLLALKSSGLHSNGYSLVRHVLLQQGGYQLDQQVTELGGPLGAELLVPTKVYAADCLQVLAATEVHAMSHITGGGLENNLLRVIPDELGIRVDWTSWQPGPIFELVRRVGEVSLPDLRATLNMGVGMVLVLPESSVDAAQRVLAARQVETWVLGEVTAS